jgi:hypothetical protein
MNHYLVEVIVTTRHSITVAADDEHEAQKLAELQKGEHGQQSAPEFTYKRPKLLGGTDG